MHSTLHITGNLSAETKRRQIALEYIAEAWNSAEADGIDGETLSHAALFAALATLVGLYGEDATANLIADISNRVERGEYTLERSIQ
ncbi:MAG TPA: hypothetical protein ENJ90_11235 [Devosia sp.]|nr:hypothetical protein [Devosia sp.]